MCAMHYTRWQKTGDPGRVRSSRGGTCTEPGCDEPHRSNGLCALHYGRKQRTGSTQLANPPSEKPWSHLKRSADPLDRLMARIEMVESGCWLWLDTLNPGGYGSFRMNGTRMGAHRASYILHVGEIPQGLDLDHLCRVRRCVNPSHLEPVTRSVNLARGVGGGWNRNITNCSKGHPFNEENTYQDPRGYRGCRTCRAEAIRRYHERKKNHG